MKKIDILKKLEQFQDDDNLLFDGHMGIWNIEKVCGKGQQYMVYYCVRKPGHEGKCYCSCKGVEFEPEEY